MTAVLRAITGAGLCLLLTAPAWAAATLRPTRAGLILQNRTAREHGLPFLRTPAEVARAVAAGGLVRLVGNQDYRVEKASFPYARPEIRTFVERVSEGYRDVCREPLVVTSLTRPVTRQPHNSSSLSVHPTGIALDLRRSWSRRCRSWLEATLLALESREVLDAAYEQHPPHYHVVVFPEPYREFLEAGEEMSGEERYLVRRGDTLWKIARRYGSTVEAIKASNAMRSDRIHPGQELRVPVLR